MTKGSGALLVDYFTFFGPRCKCLDLLSSYGEYLMTSVSITHWFGLDRGALLNGVGGDVRNLLTISLILP